MTTPSGPDSPDHSRIDPREIIRLFDQSPVFMAYIRGPEHRFDYINKALIDIIGGRDVTGKTLAEALPDAEADYKALMDQVMQSGEALRVTGARYDRQVEPGAPVTEHYVDFIYQPVLDANGKVDGILVQGDDVTDRVLAERALAEARNAAEAAELVKAEFVSQLNHDVRAPMNAVLSLIDIMAGTQPLSSEQREYLRILRLSADTVLGQVGDMVDAARIESRGVTLENLPFSPDRVVRDVINTMTVPARDKGINIALNVSLEAETHFLGDAGRIRQVLTLLGTHALRETEIGNICFYVHQDDGRALIYEVTSSGLTLSEERLRTLFERNVESRYTSGGLGLALTRTLTEMMGGQVTVKSVPQEGTTFTLRLPLASATADIEHHGHIENTLSIPGKDILPILVVEDYEPNILITTTFLEQLGYKVDVAKNGHAAVAKAKSGTYSLALMDVQMPGLNGLEATRLIREHEAENGQPRLSIVGVTAHSLAVDRLRCLEAGMDDFLPKPFNATDLQDKILSILA